MTLELPDPLYDRLKRRAEQTRSTVAAEALEVLVSAMSECDGLSEDLADTLASLALLDDDVLERAAHSHLSAESASQLEALQWKRQRDGLTEAERQTQHGLLRQYERAMLVRAQAAVRLKQRGHDITHLVTPR